MRIAHLIIGIPFALAALILAVHIVVKIRANRRIAAAKEEAAHKEWQRRQAQNKARREQEQQAAWQRAAEERARQERKDAEERARKEREAEKAQKDAERQARAAARAAKQAEKLEAARLLAEYNERALNAARELRNLQQQERREPIYTPAPRFLQQDDQEEQEEQEPRPQRRQAVSLEQFAALHAAPARRGIFAGETLSFTGTIPGIPRREAMQLTKQAGGMAYPHINTHCTLLVVGEGAECNQALEDADRWNTRKITWQTWKQHIEHDAAAA